MFLSNPKIQIYFAPQKIHGGALAVLKISVIVDKILCMCTFLSFKSSFIDIFYLLPFYFLNTYLFLVG